MADRRAPDWRLSALLVAAVLALLSLPLWLFRKSKKGTRDRTGPEVARFLSDFLEGKGKQQDWDAFTSVPITGSQLDAIRIQAAQIPLPVDDDGKRRLSDLLSRVNNFVMSKQLDG